jgi:hypothetical protein
LRLGIDATSAPAEGRLALSDDEQLAWASSQQRVLLTHNVEDFPRMHYEVTARGEHHSGIIVARQNLSVGEIIRRVAHLCASLAADDMWDRLEYLGNW